MRDSSCHGTIKLPGRSFPSEFIFRFFFQNDNWKVQLFRRAYAISLAQRSLFCCHRDNVLSYVIAEPDRLPTGCPSLLGETREIVFLRRLYRERHALCKLVELYKLAYESVELVVILSEGGNREFPQPRGEGALPCGEQDFVSKVPFLEGGSEGVLGHIVPPLRGPLAVKRRKAFDDEAAANARCAAGSHVRDYSTAVPKSPSLGICHSDVVTLRDADEAFLGAGDGPIIVVDYVDQMIYSPHSGGGGGGGVDIDESSHNGSSLLWVKGPLLHSLS